MLVRTARRNAGLSQRALAERAATAQSVIARIESGKTSPSWDTLERVLRAAGLVLDATVHVVVHAPPESSDIARVLSLDPAARLEEARNADRFVSAARRAS